LKEPNATRAIRERSFFLGGLDLQGTIRNSLERLHKRHLRDWTSSCIFIFGEVGNRPKAVLSSILILTVLGAGVAFGFIAAGKTPSNFFITIILIILRIRESSKLSQTAPSLRNHRQRFIQLKAVVVFAFCRRSARGRNLRILGKANGKDHQESKQVAGIVPAFDIGLTRDAELQRWK
jgi:hypothetical protein